MTNRVHPTAIIGPDVHLGSGNVVGPHAVILGPCVIGDDNWFGPAVCIGTPGEMRGMDHPAAWEASPGGAGITIGNGNVVREMVTIQAPSHDRTFVGDDCYLMAKAHIPHDAHVHSHVTMSTGSLIGGHCVVGEHANIGLNAVVHQRLVIGPGAMVGMASVVTKNVPPFATAYGSPARVRSVNSVGLTRLDVDASEVALLAEAYAAGTFDRPVPGREADWQWYHREASSA